MSYSTRCSSSSSAAASSSAIATSNSSRKRSLSPDVSEDEVGPKVTRKGKNTVDIEGELDSSSDLSALELVCNFTPRASEYKANEKENNNFLKLSEEAQRQCIKALARLFIFKGSRKEHISRTLLMDTLSKIDPEYKRHTNAALQRAQSLLFNTTGLTFVTAEDILGFKNGKKEEFYVVNTLYGSEFRKLLSGEGLSESEKAYRGFMFVVFHILLSSSNSTMLQEDLLREIRKLEPRFSETAGSKANASTYAPPVPELEDNFVGLIARMKKEHYIQVSKEDIVDSEQSKTLLEFGPRFFLEIGKKQLLVSYYKLLGHPVDEEAIKVLTGETSLNQEKQMEGDAD